mgnify:CR=1 FL=1
MDIIATQKFLIMSPKKLRVVAFEVRKMKPIQSIEVLPHIGKRAAEPLLKVIKSAIANAKVKGISETDLIFKEIQINEGPRLKRGRPVSRGMFHAYKKRMSHIRVVLTTNSKHQTLNSKETKKSARKEEKS